MVVLGGSLLQFQLPYSRWYVYMGDLQPCSNSYQAKLRLNQLLKNCSLMMNYLDSYLTI